MLNFTVGPVQSDESICALGANQVPYFRTPEFSQVMLENERLFLKFAGGARRFACGIFDGFCAAAWEAAVMNTLDASDKAIVVDGGSFGHRFVKLLEVHGIDHTALTLEAGSALNEEDLAPFAGAGYTALLINLCETSTGVAYDLGMVADFCRREGLFLIVDAGQCVSDGSYRHGLRRCGRAHHRISESACRASGNLRARLGAFRS